MGSNPVSAHMSNLRNGALAAYRICEGLGWNMYSNRSQQQRLGIYMLRWNHSSNHIYFGI